MSSMLALSLTLEQLVPMATTNAADMIGLEDEFGTLGIGKTADVSVLSDDRGRFILRDNEKTEVVADACRNRCSACAPASATMQTQ
jgi:dihydroorotase